MLKRKGILLLLCCCVLLSACGNQKSSGKEGDSSSPEGKNKLMGRYVETQLEIPKELAGSGSIYPVKSPEGEWNLIAATYSEKKARYEYKSYPMGQDGSIGKPEDIAWINELFNKEDGLEPSKFFQGEDGKYYMLCNQYGTNFSKDRFYQYNEENKKWEHMEIPYFEKKRSESDDYILYQKAGDAAVLKNGKLVFQSYSDGNFMLFSPEGEKQQDLPISYDAPGAGYAVNGGFGVSGNEIFGIKKDQSGIVFLDGNTGKEKQTVKIDMDKKGIRLQGLSDGNFLAADRNGIHCLSKEGTVWETVVDGSLNSMGMPTYTIHGIFSANESTKDNGKEEKKGEAKNEKPEYLILYHQNEAGYQLMHYHFDESVTAVPEKELNVYSLRENELMRQAVAQFQKNRRDVKVNYMVALEGNQEGNQDTTEYIHALNTELLNGNGADIILLDGLPLDSYIEKGILADLSELLGETKNSILPSVIKGYTKDGKIYGLPLRIQVSIAAGDQKAVLSSQSLKGMADYVRQHKDQKLMKTAGTDPFLQTMVEISWKDWLDDQKGLKEGAFRAFLEDLMVLKDNGVFVPVDNAGFSSRHGYATEAYDVMEGTSKLYAEILYSAPNLWITEAINKNKKNTWDSPDGSFYGDGLCAANTSAKDQELVKEFIQCLFSEEVQKTDLYTGFPVREDALQDWLLKEDLEKLKMGFMMSDRSDGAEEKVMKGSYPSKATRKKLYDIIMNLKEPVLYDESLRNMILEAMDGYLEGNKDADTVMNAVKEKVNLYLAE